MVSLLKFGWILFPALAMAQLQPNAGGTGLNTSTVTGPDVCQITSGVWSCTLSPSITVNSTSCPLGGSCTPTSNTTNSLTINASGSGAASGSTFNGSSAVTLSVNALLQGLTNCNTANDALTPQSSNCAPLAQTASATTNQWLRTYNASTGLFTKTQPTLTNIAAGVTGTGTYSFTSATLLVVPNASGYVGSSNGDIGYDNNAFNFHVGLNGSDYYLATFVGSLSPNQADCVSWSNPGSGIISLNDLLSGPCQYAVIAGTPSYTKGTNVTSCAAAAGYTNSNSRGEVTIVGGTATTGTICTVNFSAALGVNPQCILSQNGGATWFNLGHGTPSGSSFTITSGVSVSGSTLAVDYYCQP